MAKNPRITGIERTFAPEEIIVSKTDLKGRVLYANDVFLRVAGYTEEEVLGEPHNLVRHPDMPRTVFRVLWDTIAEGREIFAYVLNRCKNGDHYWVLAHVTPTFGPDGQVMEYHSTRYAPDPACVKAIEPVYKALLDEENSHSNRKEGLEKGLALLGKVLADKGVTYDEFIFSLINGGAGAKQMAAGRV
ncbi:MAG: PAS domain-containing protein [Magnetovibrionaceae bacterium]